MLAAEKLAGVVKTRLPTTEIFDVLDFPVNSRASALVSAWVRSNKYQPLAFVASISVAEVSPRTVTVPQSLLTYAVMFALSPVFAAPVVVSNAKSAIF